MQKLARLALLSSAATAATMLVAAPAQADSSCTYSFGGPLLIQYLCTDLNGNGNFDVDSVGVLSSISPGPTEVVGLDFNVLQINAYGYVEATSAGLAVLRATSVDPLIYVGTGSTLVGQATATGTPTLILTAPSLTVNTGNLTALGAGSSALLATATGGAGSGGGTVTVDGNITTADGDGIVVDSTSAAASQALNVVGNAGTTIAVSGGDAITVSNAGTAATTVTNASTITSGTAGVNTLQNAIVVSSTGTGSLSVVNNGAIGTAIDRAQGAGITELITNAASAGTLSATGSGNIYSVLDGINLSTVGTGGATVNYGGNINVSGGFDGVSVSTTSGNILITTGGTVTSLSNAIRTTSTSGDQTVTVNGDVSGSNTLFLYSTTGDLNLIVNADVASTANAVILTSDGTKTLTLSAGNSIATAPLSYAVDFGGTGLATVNNSGTLGTTGRVAIESPSSTTINNLAGGTLNGSLLLSGVGNTVLNAGTINLETGTVFGTGVDIVTNASGGTLNASGTIDFGAGTDAINNQAGGTATFAAGTTLLGLETLTNAGTLVAGSGLTFDGGNTALINSGTFNPAGTIDFGAGTDSLSNSLGGTMIVAAGTTLLGLETLTNSGTLTAASGLTFDGGNTAFSNSGTLNTAGTFAFAGGTDSLSNSGTINLTGATTLTGLETFSNNAGGMLNLGTTTLTGSGAFSNAGTVDTNGSASLLGFTTLSNAGLLNLAPGTFTVAPVVFTNSGTVNAVGGATTITGQTSFANSGTLNLQDGATNDTLTIVGDFAGSGGSTLAIDAGATTADKLIITGAASGTTALDVNLLTPFINTSGILVVDAGTSTTGAFVIGDSSGVSALTDLALNQVGADYYLVSAPSSLAYQPLAIGHLGNDMWYQSADVFGGYSALRRTDLRSDRVTGGGIWAQLYGSRDTAGDARTVTTGFGNVVDIDSRMRTIRRGAQVGMDFLPLGTGFVIGATGGYQHAKSNLRGYGNALDAQGFNMGVYAMIGAKSGLYGTLLVKHDRNKVALVDPAFGDAGRRLNTHSNGAELEAGYRMDLSGLNLNLNAGIAHVRTKVEDFVVGPLAYELRGVKSMRGRLGARIGMTGSWGPYIDAKLLHEFKGDSRMTLAGGGDSFDVETQGRGTWGRVEVGAGANNAPGPILAGWADFGDVKGLGARAGFRF